MNLGCRGAVPARLRRRRHDNTSAAGSNNDTNAEETGEQSNDGSVDRARSATTPPSKLLAGVTCEHTMDGIEDETAV
jgi:hypothetical protein